MNEETDTLQEKARLLPASVLLGPVELLRLVFIRLLLAYKKPESRVGEEDMSEEENAVRDIMSINGEWWDVAVLKALDETPCRLSDNVRKLILDGAKRSGLPCNSPQ